MSNLQHAASEEWRRTRKIFAYGIILVLGLVAVSIGLWIYFGAWTHGPWMEYRGFGFSWIWAVFAFFLLFWVFRWVFWPWGARPYGYSRYVGDDAVTVLRARYARGEVTKEEFDRMMRDLRGHGHGVED